MTHTSNLIKRLSYIIKDGNNETDTLSILILVHLLEVIRTIAATEDGFIRYDYCILREHFDISHKVLKNRLNRLHDFSLINYKCETVKGDKKGLFIHVNMEEINKYLGIAQSDEDSRECPCGNTNLPTRDSQPTQTDTININYIQFNDDDNAIENPPSDSDSLESPNHVIEQICSNVKQAEVACKCKFGSVTKLFNLGVPLMISAQGRIHLGDSTYDADDFLSKISKLPPDRIIKVFRRVNSKPTLSSWEAYLLKSLYCEADELSSKAPIIPFRTTNPVVKKKYAGYTQCQYDFVALQKYIEAN